MADMETLPRCFLTVGVTIREELGGVALLRPDRSVLESLPGVDLRGCIIALGAASPPIEHLLVDGEVRIIAVA